MSPLEQKPIIHGRDHAAGGADPIPGLAGGGIDFNTYPQDGDWLYIETTGAGSPPFYSLHLVSGDQFVIEAATAIGITANAGSIAFTATDFGFAGDGSG